MPVAVHKGCQCGMPLAACRFAKMPRPSLSSAARRVSSLTSATTAAARASSWGGAWLQRPWPGSGHRPLNQSDLSNRAVSQVGVDPLHELARARAAGALPADHRPARAAPRRRHSLRVAASRCGRRPCSWHTAGPRVRAMPRQGQPPQTRVGSSPAPARRRGLPTALAACASAALNCSRRFSHAVAGSAEDKGPLIGLLAD